MPRASDIKLDDHNMSFLLIGENGSYKTRFLGTMPFEVYVFDFDKGLASVRGAQHIEYDIFKDAPWRGKERKELGIYKFGTGWKAFLDRLNAIGELIDKGTCPYKALAIDSYTMMAELLMNHVINSDDKITDKSKNPEIQHWNTFNRSMRNVLDQFTSWPLIKVVTAHIERAENPLTNGIEQLPLANGKMQGLLPNFFDEVYFCDVTTKTEGGQKIPVPTLQTVKDAVRKNARSRWHVPAGTPTEWPALMKALQAAAK